MPAPTHPSNLQRRIHAGGGRVLEQRKSTGVRIHTTPQVGADGKPAEAPHRRAHGDDYPLEFRSSLTNRHMKTIDDATVTNMKSFAKALRSTTRLIAPQP